MEKLKGKTALVTGASRGIGRAIAERLAADGAAVAVHYGRNDAAAEEVVAGIKRAGGSAFPIRAEFGVDGDREIDVLFAGLGDGLKEKPLDILVNNAGILDATPFAQLTREAFDRTIAINVRAPFFIMQRALPLLPDGGRIITISSAVTRIASGFFHYAMAKGALEVLNLSLAQLLGHRRITVNAVSPGVVDTDMGGWAADPQVRAAVVSTVALGRLGQPADIADIVAFLASDDARWITGQSLDASGGTWLGPNVS